MKTKSTEVISDLQINSSDYNKILWIIDNMFFPTENQADKIQFLTTTGVLEAAGMIKNGHNANDNDKAKCLTNDEIDVVQQLALWYYTNSSDPTYHTYKPNTSNDKLLRNQLQIKKDGDGINFEPLNNYGSQVGDGNGAKKGTLHAYRMEVLYEWFITNAEKHSDYSPSTTTPKDAITIKSENKTSENNGNYIMGPFKIEKHIGCTITNIEIKDEKGQNVQINDTNKVLSSNKQTTTLEALKNSTDDFYISVPKTSNISSVTVTVTAKYTAKTATYYTTGTATAKEQQPVVLVEEKEITDSEEATVSLQKLDLALRKSITKIGDTKFEDRLPQVDVSKLKNKTSTTATYNHPKNDLIAKKDQIIEYTLTVYNEGTVKGYAKEIKDYLPKGIEFKELVSPSAGYSASSTKDEKTGKTTITITHNGSGKVLEAFNSETGKLDSEQITIRCEIKAENKTENQRLVNIAEITKYHDSSNNTDVDTDLDSHVANFPETEKNNDYKGNGTENDGKYTKGQEDDDDFEGIVVPVTFFDLALRKSITKIGDTPVTSRLPQVDVANLKNKTSTTATYNHPKNDLIASEGQFIEYTLTVYNEGNVDGYAKEIKDYLPKGIEFVELVSAPTGYSEKHSTDLATGVTTIIITNEGKSKVLKGYDGSSNTLDSEAITIKCKITAKVSTQNQRLVNIAEITKYHNDKEDTDIDLDSHTENFPDGKKNNDYNGNGTENNGNYTKGQEDDDDFEGIIIPSKYFDLSLRKFVTAINGRTLSDSRAPVPDVTKLLTGESTTATYNGPKTPVSVKVGDIVTYTIRVYNEGFVDGYASEITDHLPPQLEFLPEDEENIANGWYLDENDTSLRTIKTEHLSKKVNPDNLIVAFNGETLAYKDITVKCKVKNTVLSGDKITNIAEITGSTDKDDKSVTDRDSEVGDVELPQDPDLPNYKDPEIEKGDKYIPGQEDDDDFEKLKVQIFDLALRKFITAVGDESITNRIPEPTLGEDGKIKYNHTKDPVGVGTGDVVIYTIRIYNEGDIAGYASEITDDLPEGLKYLPENLLNTQYRWKMIDESGKETTDVTKAVKVTTDYLSKAQETTDGANLLKAFNTGDGITPTNPDYKDVKIAFEVIEPNTSNRILTNIAQVSDDSDEFGNPVEDVDSTPGNDDMDEDDIDKEHVRLQYFDLALRKFITKVNNLDINNRYPVPKMDKEGKIKYEHTKDPVEVENGNIVTYTIRVYNEGSMAGYASEVTDDLPEGLEYLPDNETNKQYRWKMIDSEGKETEDVKEAKKITTDYLSKEQEKADGENLIKEFNPLTGITDTNPDYRDVKVAFKVTEPNTSDRILINTAEISDDSDKDGNPVEDVDSTPGNDKDAEDDIDKEKVRVKYFDLALKKWVSQVLITESGKQTVTNTGHTGDENPEPVVKVDLKAKDVNKVTVKFAYKIKVTNEGEIEGYAKEVKDYIPDGLKFVASDNPKWTALNEKEVVTDQLQNKLLKPGESATVDIILTWENSQNNLGVKVNVAEISKDYNDSNTPDIDSTPNNKKDKEDDIDDAPVVLGIKTGEARIYFTLTGIILVTLAGGIILIKKYVL